MSVVKFFSGLVALIGALGAVEYLFQPVTNLFRYHIFSEDIVVESKQILAKQYDTVKTDISLSNKSALGGISGGRLELISRDQSKVILIGETTFHFNRSPEDIVRIPGNDKKIAFQPRVPGDNVIDAKIVTIRGNKFSGRITVKTRPVSGIRVPEFRGSMNVRMNGLAGRLEIEPVTGPFGVKGRVKFEDGVTWKVTRGTIDGLVFNISATSSDGFRYRVDGVHCTHGGYKVVNAIVEKQSLDGKIIDMAAATPSKSEKCVGQNGKVLREAEEGKGYFYASARILSPAG